MGKTTATASAYARCAEIDIEEHTKMQQRMTAAWLACLLTVGTVGSAAAFDDDLQTRGPALRWQGKDSSFQRLSTLANYRNNANRTDLTVSEIVAATRDGLTLVYTDSPLGQIGFIDIKDPAKPLPNGKLDVGGEPTSVAVLGNSLALVSVNTSESLANPSGKLVVIELASRETLAELDLGGQPDSLKISPDGRYAAVAIENERDEDIVVDGVEGGLPQLPAGYLAIIDLKGRNPADWTRRDVDLRGLSRYAPQDPEPEFVDINRNNQAVVSLQENNHIVVVDLVRGRIVRHFDAGSVDLDGVDATEDGVISLTEFLAEVPREPDAVTWLPGNGRGADLIATANEGDLFGGSRGFSIFSRNGRLLFDSGTTLEELAVQFGHYPEERSENKGTEPESIAYARFDRDDYLFVGSERGSFIAVYQMQGAQPRFSQLLPAPLGPEGLLAIPARKLLIAAGEEDDPEFGVRSTLMIYQLQPGSPTYPQILSDGTQDTPLPWAALSGMVAMPGQRNTLLAVWDSFFSESRVLTLDVSAQPAVITESLPIQGGTGNYDPEGIAIAPDGSLWIASEGNASDARPNRLLQLDDGGKVIREIGLPAEILACRAASANRGTLGSGFEGVAVMPLRRGYRLLVAQQRGWDYTTPECEGLDDDAGGLNARGEPNRTRIWIYDPGTDRWDHIAWELAPLPANAAWVGLSEITRTPRGDYVVIERDNLSGDFAELKSLAQFRPAAAFDGVVTQAERRVFDLLPALQSTNGWISDKPEGVAITRDGRTFMVTDNDGVDGWSGETWFLELGRERRLFR